MSAFVIIFVLALFLLSCHALLVWLPLSSFCLLAIAALAFFQICCFFYSPFFFFHELAAIVVLSLFIIAAALPGLLSHLLSLLISPLLNSSFLILTLFTLAALQCVCHAFIFT